MAESTPAVPRGVDLERPSAARMYDWFLGGETHWAVDREFGRQVLDVFPIVGPVARGNRFLLQRIVRHLVKRGVRQFVDLGSGIPTAGNVHQIADELDPGSAVVYVDNESVAVVHSEHLLREHGDPARHAAVDADLRSPSHVWSRVERAGVLDPEQPIALLMMAVLHFVRGEGEAEQVLERYRGFLPAGSYLALSHASVDGVRRQRADEYLKLVEMYERTSNPVRLRTREEIRALFGDFELLDPGLAWAPEWHPEEAASGEDESLFRHPDESVVLGGVARKPQLG